ncbi:hypothetical protein SDC9_03903 [bioreactor metagenome]|uniref:DUF4363 family protein n=1 Tax=bioreactor metagenome TaxID=1076179 RepID=A0A644SXL8_9ZZZZ|nr:DUF4363 family protein [Negativicutes bacterium]
MVYHTGKRMKLRAMRVGMLKKIFLSMLLSGILIFSCSCTLLTDSLDSRSGFSNHLAQVENSIRNEDWDQATASLKESKKAWEKIKPLLQVDIDHDYVEEIEEGFVKLDGYIDVKDKSNSLVSVLLIENIWDNIGSF